MNVPDLNRVYHTFRSIQGLNLNDIPGTVLAVRRFIQNEVRCLVDGLTSNELISWFGFHVHHEGQYLGRGNTGPLGIHLRFELGDGVTFEQVAVHLNELGWASSSKERVSMDTISGINGPRFEGDTDFVTVDQLRNRNIAYAWKAIGEASEWVLDVLSAYDLDPVPVSQLRQHLHFISNLLYIYNNIPLLPVDINRGTNVTDF